MNINPKTEHLTKWKKGQPSPNPFGRKPKFVSTLKSQGYTQSEIIDSILTLLAFSKNELVNIIENENLTILEETIASVLLESLRKRNLYAIECLLNRSIGITKESNRIYIPNEIVNITLNLNN